METRANYALIGGFTLAVIAAAFLFVFWFSGGQKPAGRIVYRVVFPGAVTGLVRGANVLFNGVRVGEVTAVDLLENDPAHVVAKIEVDKRVPIKADTKAQLEYTGLTGLASVGLAGGSASAAALEPGPDGEMAVINAERSDFTSLLQTATRLSGKLDGILEKADKLVTEAGPALTTTAKNAAVFSQALADNAAGLKTALGAFADIGAAVKPLAAKLETLTGDTDAIMKAVDPGQVKIIVADTAAFMGKLSAAGDKFDGVLTSLNGFLGTGAGESKGAFAEVAEAAKSMRKLTDNLDVRTREITTGIKNFTGPGLKQYEALAVDGRRTLDDISRVMRSLERDPSQVIFGAKPQVPEFRSGSR